MAFVSRSYRHTEEDRIPTTGPNVAPGAYKGQDEYRIDHSYAPFSSTCERVTHEGINSSTYTPGPGTYQQSVQSARRPRPSNVFTNKLARFHQDKSTPTESPGPGTYGERNAWIKNTHHYVLEQPVRRVTFQRMPTAPSVPTKAQSYGYEEGEGGELVMQKPPGAGHKGTRDDNVGPAKYSPNYQAVKPNRETDFAKSRSQREIFDLPTNPGPGHYTKRTERATLLGNTYPGYENNTGGPSSNFASRVPLKHQVELSEHEETPGPGTYGNKSQFKGSPVPQAHQFFGSTQLRQYQVDQPRLRGSPTGAKTPGPGAYDERRSGFAPPRMGPDAPPFHSTSVRFNLPKQAVANPGPGTYDENGDDSMVGDLSKKLVSRNGVFGTTTMRFASSKSSSSYMFLGRDEAPGPGTYEAPEDQQTAAPEARVKKASANFSSTSNRFTKPAPTDPAKPKTMSEHQVPPPGSYEVTNFWDEKKKMAMRRSEAFISAAPRFPSGTQVAGTATKTPGPGSYDSKNGEKPTHNRSCFISNSNRFGPSTTVAPGPGSYNSDDPSSAMLKRSFNVTIDGVNF
mmetsp:Transcript_36326/g.43931  ORF Transcript_36326/g.43931 Transcript_36326/m.43931 type:complete len:568 (+) Transcript_36326:276-1979(+)|eukprot:CAMPEP_0197854952 /NCGR_PEP_ID=MMETSP1438-20131217/25649_1 /TAXON_ID=1461541 /ORGANISM="Pterosperma sp., Strain CCMP1384" /LENGTH=567 /DNA_ID=CAMNT_0043469883 /DNA_START=274 /DNA_END=1977 /DNA_ORIENTATION=+